MRATPVTQEPVNVKVESLSVEYENIVFPGAHKQTLCLHHRHPGRVLQAGVNLMPQTGSSSATEHSRQPRTLDVDAAPYSTGDLPDQLLESVTALILEACPKDKKRISREISQMLRRRSHI